MKKMVVMAILLLSLCAFSFAEEPPSVISVGYNMNFSMFFSGWQTPNLKIARLVPVEKGSSGFGNRIKLVVLEICPVSETFCKIAYTDGLVEYIKKGDRFYYHYKSSSSDSDSESYICTVTSFAYNKVFLDVKLDENDTITKNKYILD